MLYEDCSCLPGIFNKFFGSKCQSLWFHYIAKSNTKVSSEFYVTQSVALFFEVFIINNLIYPKIIFTVFDRLKFENISNPNKSHPTCAACDIVEQLKIGKNFYWIKFWVNQSFNRFLLLILDWYLKGKFSEWCCETFQVFILSRVEKDRDDFAFRNLLTQYEWKASEFSLEIEFLFCFEWILIVN